MDISEAVKVADDRFTRWTLDSTNPGAYNPGEDVDADAELMQAVAMLAAWTRDDLK